MKKYLHRVYSDHLQKSNHFQKLSQHLPPTFPNQATNQNNELTWSKIQKNTRKHTPDPCPLLENQNWHTMELWGPLHLLILMAALILQRFRFLCEPVSSFLSTPPRCISFYPKTIHQTNAERRLKYRIITWVVPPPSNSHHQDYYIFSRGSQPKPSFATIASWEGGQPKLIITEFLQVQVYLPVTTAVDFSREVAPKNPTWSKRDGNAYHITPWYMPPK